MNDDRMGRLARLRARDGSLSTWVGRVTWVGVRRGDTILELAGDQRRREARPDELVFVDEQTRLFR